MVSVEQLADYLQARADINEDLATRGMDPHGETIVRAYELAAEKAADYESPELVEDFLEMARKERALDFLAA
jgi:hypothetical protein